MSLEDQLYPLLRLYEAAPVPLRLLVGRVYRTLPKRWRFGSHFARFEKEAHESVSWNAKQIETYQIKALRESLLVAAETPFYRERFDAHQVDPKKFESLEQLKEYPVLTKQDLIEHRESMVNPLMDRQQRLLVTTGGSSGIPVGFYLQKGISRPKEKAYLEAQWSRRGWKPDERMAVIRGSVTSSKAMGRISYLDTTRHYLILSSYHLTSERMPEYWRRLQEFKPRHLHVYPSAALLLARWMVDENKTFDFDLKAVLCGSEVLSLESQKFLEKVFRAPVMHWYGHSERAVLAAQGAHSNHLYFWPTYGFAELGETNLEGQCEVIGTTFHNQVMPLIRYRTGDYVKLPETPEGEMPGLEINAVTGRSYEFLVSATNRKISLTAMNMHDDVFKGIYAMQFAQTKPGQVEFRYQPAESFHQSRESMIRDALLKKLGDDFSLTLKAVTEIPKTSGGKARWLETSLSQGLVSNE